MKEKIFQNWFNTLSNVELPTKDKNILETIRQSFQNGNDCCTINEFTIDFVNSITFGKIENFPYAHIIIYENVMDSNIVFATKQQMSELCNQLGCDYNSVVYAINDCYADIIDI